MTFDPEKHHRRSIRLKGHDYAGGGLYFVTLCAHRDAGKVFAPKEVREMVAQEWEAAVAAAVGAPLVDALSVDAPMPAPASAPFEKGGHKVRPYLPYAIMPDHFHALIRIAPGGTSLGDVIGAFKSRVVHQYIQHVKSGEWPPFSGKIWHRNYYEMIVRAPDAEKKIANYIRMNPWRCVQVFGNGLRGMGNPALWNAQKTGILCSRKGVPDIDEIPEADVYFGGFHSPPEKRILEELLKRRANIIHCPAWGLDNVAEQFLPALEENRLLILEMKDRSGDLAAAERRNRFVIQNSDRLWTPCITPGGMLDRLLKE